MRWGLLVALAVFALFLASPAVALAAEGADGKSKIDLFAGWLDMSIYTIVVFLILLAILNTFAWPQIKAGLQAREQSIANDRAEADRAKAEAEAARKELAEKLAKANDEIRGMMEKARADANTAAALEAARAKEELAAEKKRLREELDRARDQALLDVWKSGATLATLISAKTIRKHLSEDDHRALVDDALAEFRSSAQTRLNDLTSARA
jgi:F-type H+-transporting ATPase subunit b